MTPDRDAAGLVAELTVCLPELAPRTPVAAAIAVIAIALRSVDSGDWDLVIRRALDAVDDPAP